MNAAQVSVRPPDGGFTDGLGTRLKVTDATTGETLELLALRPELLRATSFEFALRERAARLANFRHEDFARVRRIDRTADGGLAIVSDFVEGTRLSTVLARAAERRLPLDVGAAFCLVRQLVPAVAFLHDNARDVAHGAIALERLVVTPHGRLMIMEHVLGSALEQLRYSREHLWRECRVAMPPSAGAPRFDHHADVTQIGVVVLQLVLGRPLKSEEYPVRLAALVDQATMTMAGGERKPLSLGLHSWLVRTLHLDLRRAFSSAREATQALEQMLAAEPGYVAAPVALETFLGRVAAPAGQAQPLAPIVAPNYIEHAAPSFIAPPSPPIHKVEVEPPATDIITTPPRPTPAIRVQPPSSVVTTPAQPLPALRVEPPAASVPVARVEPPAVSVPVTRVEPPVVSVPVARVEPPAVSVPVARVERPTVSVPVTRVAPHASVVITPPQPLPSPRAEPPTPPRVMKPWLDSSPAVVTTPPRPIPAPRIEPWVAAAQIEPVASAPTRRFESDLRETLHLNRVEVEPIAASIEPRRPAQDPEPMFGAVEDSRARRGSRRLVAAVIATTILTGGVFAARYLAPAASSAELGVLLVESKPSGVQVFVDGEARGLTPAKLSVKPGPHLVELRGRGTPRVRTVKVIAGTQVSHYVELAGASTPITGELDVRSDPPGARVTIDGHSAGVAPILISNLQPGEHTVVLQNNHGSVRHTVTIEPGLTASLVAPMAEGPASGWISIAAPFAMSIYENGNLVGSTESDRILVPAGRHEFEIVNETLGFRVTHIVQVPAGRVTPIGIEIPNGTVNLNAAPWAEVWVDGRNVGETPIGNLSLPIGPHEIVFRHPQFGERRHAISVTAGTPVRLSVDMRPQ
jgi:hypothetical protein